MISELCWNFSEENLPRMAITELRSAFFLAMTVCLTLELEDAEDEPLIHLKHSLEYKKIIRQKSAMFLKAGRIRAGTLCCLRS